MRRVRKRRVIGTMACLVGVTVLALGLAGLPSRAEADVIHSCVKTKKGSIRIVAPGTVCKSSETALTWNSAGPTEDISAFTCPPDSVRSGSTCLDKYEASVWQIPPGNTAVIARIKNGTVTLAELTAAGVQLGIASNDYGAGCPNTGNGCTDFYAVSIPGVTPSRYLTWFQAAAAARNSGKRLPTNQEWQASALGTPDGAPCIVAGAPGLTGTAGCVSDVGAFDMVGNLWEWVADWVPLSTACSGWGAFSDDTMCLAGADATGGPAALLRGGGWANGADAGVFAVSGRDTPSNVTAALGFRAAR